MSSRQNCEKINFGLSSHPVCGILLWQPEQTKISLFRCRSCLFSRIRAPSTKKSTYSLSLYSPQTFPNAHFTPAFASLFLLPSVVQLFITYIRWATLAILAFAHLILPSIRDSRKLKGFLRERERGYGDYHNLLPLLQTLR